MTLFSLLLLSVFLLDALLGDPRSSLHPVALFGRWAGIVERFCRKTFGNGIASGAIGWMLLTLPTAFLTGLMVRVAADWNAYAALAIAAIIGWATVALKSLTDHAKRIRIPLEQGDIPKARHALSMIVSRDTENLAETDIVRGGIESVGENLIDAVTSAYFWMFLGWLIYGIPGAAAGCVFLRTSNTLDACWGYKNERYLFFGRVAARMDDFVHFIPARLTLLAIAVAAFVMGGKPLEAVRKAIRHRKDHPSPNSGYGMASFAGALGIRLGGPTVYHGVLEDYPYWGDGRSELKSADLKRAEILAWASALLFLLILIGISALFGR